MSIENRKQPVPNLEKYSHYSPLTGEEYLFTSDPRQTEAANELERLVWEDNGFGDSTDNRKYDEQSKLIIAMKGSVVIGSARLFESGSFVIPALSEMPYSDSRIRDGFIDKVAEGKVQEFGTVARDPFYSSKSTARNLFRSAYRYAKDSGVEGWLDVMEPERVQKMNEKYGFTFIQVSDTINYQGGDVAAHYLDFEAVETHMWSRKPISAHWFSKRKLRRPR